MAAPAAGSAARRFRRHLRRRARRGSVPAALREVRADWLKIDRSYVQGVPTDDRDRALVQLLIDFAGRAGLTVTAEGVEALAQRDALLAMGCQYAQGWLFSRAEPPQDLCPEANPTLLHAEDVPVC